MKNIECAFPMNIAFVAVAVIVFSVIEYWKKSKNVILTFPLSWSGGSRSNKGLVPYAYKGMTELGTIALIWASPFWARCQEYFRTKLPHKPTSHFCDYLKQHETTTRPFWCSLIPYLPHTPPVTFKGVTRDTKRCHINCSCHTGLGPNVLLSDF